jgi:two-component system sensor kinase FixL
LSVGEANLPDGRLFTGIVRDLTERKRLEDRLLQASEDEQRRIGRDIHDDICQQLAGIGCLLKVIQQNGASGGVAPEQLDEIGRLISDANSRAREIARGLVPVVLESEGLPTALEELAESSSRLFNVSCLFSAEPGVTVEESRKKVHLFRIVKEAIANAVRHGEAKNIWIRLGADGGKLNLSITDDGKGFRVAEEHSGMGMLTMAHRVKTMAGTIQVESAPGKGTRINCEIPLT